MILRAIRLILKELNENNILLVNTYLYENIFPSIKGKMKINSYFTQKIKTLKRKVTFEVSLQTQNY